MMEFDVTITKVDYETNTIYAKTDGAEIVITTFNKEIDNLYDQFYKHERLGAVHMHLILKNWDYTPESEDSYQANTSRIYKKIHYRGKKAKNTEDEQIHNLEIQKED
jgi:membrane-bound lytic murein transglycosylase MltF